MWPNLAFLAVGLSTEPFLTAMQSYRYTMLKIQKIKFLSPFSKSDALKLMNCINQEIQMQIKVFQNGSVHFPIIMAQAQKFYSELGRMHCIPQVGLQNLNNANLFFKLKFTFDLT